MNPFIEYINDCGEAFVGSAGLMLIQSSVLIAILFALDFVLRKRIRAVFRYCLWMLVLVKLTLPSSLAAPYSLGYWLADTVDRVESSLASPINPSYSPVDGVTDSWPAPVEVAIDDFPSQILPVAAEGSALPATDISESTFFIEDPATEGLAGSYPVEPEPAANLVEVLPVRQADSARDEVAALKWQAVLFVLWLVVCIATGLLVLQKTLLLGRLVRQAPPANKRLVALFESCRERIVIGRAVTLRVSPIIPTPAVYGLFRPTVLIPERMLTDELDTNELKTIFVHELMHIQRGDLWVKLLQTILQVVYFYNPLLWLANATIRRVRELAVDEAVLVILGKSTSEVYPRTLIKVAGWAFDQPVHGLRLIGVMESNGLLTERIKIMLDKPIPRSKKIGVIGLTVLFALGVFLLPMARADKRVGVAIPEPVSSVDEDVVASDDIAPPEPAAFGGGVFTAVMAPVSGRISGFIYDPANGKVTAEIEMALAEIAKDMTEIEAIKLQIKSMQQQIQMKLDMLQQKEDELAVMFPDRNAKADDYVLTGVETRPPKRSMHSVHVGSAAHQHQPTPTGTTWGRPTIADEPEYTGTVSRTRRRSADPYIEVTPRQPLYNRRADPQKNVSGEVRKELQRILPGLLREILPRLLAEAMAEAVNNAPSQQSMTEPMQDTRLVPPKMPMPPPSMGALPMPVPRPPVPRVKTRADDLVEDPLLGPVNAGEPPAIPRKL